MLNRLRAVGLALLLGIAGCSGNKPTEDKPEVYTRTIITQVNFNKITWFLDYTCPPGKTGEDCTDSYINLTSATGTVYTEGGIMTDTHQGNVHYSHNCPGLRDCQEWEPATQMNLHDLGDAITRRTQITLDLLEGN
jgi:hypothetical protein